MLHHGRPASSICHATFLEYLGLCVIRPMREEKMDDYQEELLENRVEDPDLPELQDDADEL